MKLVHMTASKMNGSYYIMVLDEDAEEYIYMVVVPGEPDNIMAKYPVSEYKDREHFAGVIGKFMPYTWILSEEAEIEIEEPSLPELRRAEAILKKRNKSL